MQWQDEDFSDEEIPSNFGPWLHASPFEKPILASQEGSSSS